MNNTMNLIVVGMLAVTGNIMATSIAPSASHEVASSKGKFKLKVDTTNLLHQVSGAFKSWSSGWQFRHEVSNHSFFISDDGEAAAVVHWSWCQVDDLDEAAVVIYGRDGARRIFTYNELSKPRKRGDQEMGPIGDFWRVWRGDVTLKGNLLTIEVEGGKPCVIDLQSARLTTTADAAGAKPSEAAEPSPTRDETEKRLRDADERMLREAARKRE